jgi:hypothetical protein
VARKAHGEWSRLALYRGWWRLRAMGSRLALHLGWRRIRAMGVCCWRIGAGGRLEKGGERACEWLICGFVAGLGRVNKSRNCHQVERGPRKVKFGSIGWGELTKIIFLLVFSKTDESYFDHRKHTILL